MLLHRLTLKLVLGTLLMAPLASQSSQDPEVPAAAAPDAPRPDAQPPEAQHSDAFDVDEYRVEGNTVLPAIVIERAVYPHLGPHKTIADVRGAKESLEQAYHDAGYLTVLVSIPEQRVDNGVVRLTVIEGKVERMRVSGARYTLPSAIKARVPSLAEGNVPYFPEVQTELADASTARDRRIVPTLQAGRTPGTVDVNLQVQDRLPIHGSIEANDRYSANTEHARVAAMLRYDNLWQRDHSLAVQYQAAPSTPSETSVLSASYVLPLGEGRNLAAYAIRSRSNVATVGDYRVLGNMDIAGMRWIRALPSRQGFSHNLSLGADYKHSLEGVAGGTDSVSTPVSYMPLVAQYSLTLADDSGATQLDTAANFSLRGLRNNETQFAERRYKASPNYFYLRGGIQRTQVLPGNYNLFARLDFQLPSGPLLSSEQFAVGGAESVRGYLEGERAGDAGARVTMELRTPKLASKEHASIDQFYLLGFLDGATVRVRDPLPGQEARFTLSSAGIGLRFTGWKSVHFNLDYAVPFKNGQYTASGDGRFHARLAYEF